MKVTIAVLEICDEFCWDCLSEVKEDRLLNVTAVLIDIELLDVEFTQLVDCFIGLGEVNSEWAGVGHLG